MRVTGFWAAFGLVVVGVMMADLIANPAGTNALGTQVVNGEKVTFNALLGKSS